MGEGSLLVEDSKDLLGDLLSIVVPFFFFFFLQKEKALKNIIKQKHYLAIGLIHI